MPSFLEYYAEKGKLPACLTMSLAAYIAFYSNDIQDLDEKGLHCRRPKGNGYTINDDRWVLEFFWEHRNDSPEQLVQAVLSHPEMWGGQDLTKIPGLAETVTDNLQMIRERGALAAFRSCL